MADTAIYGKRSQGADIFIVVVRVFIYRDENSRQKANCGAEFYRLCRRDFHRVYRGGVEHGDGGAVLSFSHRHFHLLRAESYSRYNGAQASVSEIFEGRGSDDYRGRGIQL